MNGLASAPEMANLLAAAQHRRVCRIKSSTALFSTEHKPFVRPHVKEIDSTPISITRSSLVSKETAKNTAQIAASPQQSEEAGRQTPPRETNEQVLPLN